MELLLLLVILPAVQDQNHTREGLKAGIKAWCSMASYILDLRSYLFGDVPLEQSQNETTDDEDPQGEDEDGEDGDGEDEDVFEEEIVDEDMDGNGDDVMDNVQVEGLGAVHHALLQRDPPTGFQAYNRPNCFALRVSNTI